MTGGTILTPPYTSHFDGNQVSSMMGVEGTLGTADTSGTARPLPIGVNPQTGAQYIQAPSISSYGISGTATIGTLIDAAGVGTKIYVSAMSISQVSGTSEVVVSFGTTLTGTQVIERGLFVAGGGLQASYPAPIDAGTSNVPLTWNMISGAGTIAITIKYWTGN